MLADALRRIGAGETGKTVINTLSPLVSITNINSFARKSQGFGCFLGGMWQWVVLLAGAFFCCFGNVCIKEGKKYPRGRSRGVSLCFK